MAAGPRTVKISSERAHDTRRFAVGEWCRDHLLIVDLRYHHVALFDSIERYGGYFISVIKANANPVIVGVNGTTHCGGFDLLGQRLMDVLSHLRRPVLNLEPSFCRRIYAGVRATARRRFRLVGMRVEEKGEHHLYVTNLPVDKIPATDIDVIYRESSVIELTFKHQKSSFHLAGMPSRKKHVVESLIYASVLTLLISKQLLLALRENLGKDEHRFKECR